MATFCRQKWKEYEYPSETGCRITRTGVIGLVPLLSEDETYVVRMHMNIWDIAIVDVRRSGYVRYSASRFITLSSVMRATNTCRVFLSSHWSS
jgi:hypothetical protein